MSAATITLRPWSDGDLDVLRLTLGNAAMMQHLGGVETEEQILARHQRYLRAFNSGGMFTIRFENGDAAGSIGFWEREWLGNEVYETGWMVLPRFADRGIATEAARIITRYAAAEHRRRFMHAYPSVENGPSNAVCRKAGFTNSGEYTFEYPKGHFMRCNDWVIDLSAISP
jgi:RimJ/RimL family protein N-acetyltransferase